MRTVDELIFTHSYCCSYTGHKKMLSLGTLNGISDDKWCLMGIKWPQTKSDSTFRIPTCCGAAVLIILWYYFPLAGRTLLSPQLPKPSLLLVQYSLVSSTFILSARQLARRSVYEYLKCSQFQQSYPSKKVQWSPLVKWKSFYWWHDSLSLSLIQYLIEGN